MIQGYSQMFSMSSRCKFEVSKSIFVHFLPPAGASPSSSLKRSAPTATVSSSLAYNSTIVPALGEFTATST